VPSKPTHVLIVDDDPLFAAVLQLLVEADERIAVVGHASNGAAGVERAHRLRPDVVLMDIEMPVVDGLEAAARIRRELPATRVILISGAADPELGARARAAGAHDFLRKGCDPEELVEVVLGPEPAVHAASWRPPSRPRLAAFPASRLARGLSSPRARRLRRLRGA